MMGGYWNYDRKQNGNGLNKDLSASDVEVKELYITEVEIELWPVILLIQGGTIVMINHLGFKKSFAKVLSLSSSDSQVLILVVALVSYVIYVDISIDV